MVIVQAVPYTNPAYKDNFGDKLLGDSLQHSITTVGHSSTLLLWNKLITAASKDEERNLRILDIITESYSSGQKILVLSLRLDQIDVLVAACSKFAPSHDVATHFRELPKRNHGILAAKIVFTTFHGAEMETMPSSDVILVCFPHTNIGTLMDVNSWMRTSQFIVLKDSNAVLAAQTSKMLFMLNTLNS